MKFVSKAALAAAVVLAVPFAVSAPADAQKKEKKQKQAPLKISESFRKAAADIETSIKAQDFAAAAGKLEAVTAAAQSDDEKYYAANFRLQVAVNQKDNAGIISALDMLLVNPRTPAADLSRFNFVRGEMTLSGKQYVEALPFLLKAKELGYTPTGGNLDLVIANAQLNANQLDAGIASIDAAIKSEEAAGRKAPETWYQFAVSKLYTGGKKALASEWLDRQLAAYPSPEGWRSALLIYLEQLREKGVETDADLKLDVMRLMRAAKALGGEFDYQEYADLAQRRGLPWEAKSVIEEGRANGKIQASNAAINDLYRSAIAREKLEGNLATEEKAALANAKGVAAKNIGDAYLGSGNNAKAAELYRASLSKGGVDTNLVNTRLGIALARAGNKAEAQAAFANVTGAPRNEIARFWITWLGQQAN